MIIITVNKEKSHLEVNGTTFELVKDVAELLHILRTEEIFRGVYPLAKLIEENYAKNNTSN